MWGGDEEPATTSPPAPPTPVSPSTTSRKKRRPRCHLSTQQPEVSDNLSPQILPEFRECESHERSLDAPEKTISTRTGDVIATQSSSLKPVFLQTRATPSIPLINDQNVDQELMFGVKGEDITSGHELCKLSSDTLPVPDDKVDCSLDYSSGDSNTSYELCNIELLCKPAENNSEQSQSFVYLVK